MTLTPEAMSPSIENLGIEQPESGLSELDAASLNKYIGSLFLLRETLMQSSPEAVLTLDEVLGKVLFIATQRRDLSQLMGEAQLLGWVDNGADILPLLEPYIRLSFAQEKLVSLEQLNQIPIIGVVGKIASGKGTVAKVLNEEFDVVSYPFSDRLRYIALAMGFRPPFTRAQLRQVNDVYKPAFGNQIFVEWTLIRATRQTQSLHVPELIVMDGFRSVSETEFFLDQPNTSLIALIADEDAEEDRRIRFERQKDRARGEEDSAAWEDFMKDDSVESGWIDPVIDLVKQRGIVVMNNATLEDLVTNIKVAVGELGLEVGNNTISK